MTKTLLFVDDDPFSQWPEILQRKLENSGYIVICHDNSENAIESIEGGLRYDIALVDRSLGDCPGIRGWKRSGDDVMRISREKNPSVPIISLSAYHQKAPDADYHITKPESLDRTVEIVNQHLPI